MITLDATINTDLGYSHLQALRDRAPRLYSLSVYYLNNFSMTSFNLRSTSIRRLEFFPDSFLCSTKYFNIAECTSLANSSLGCQCEVLIIYYRNIHILLFEIYVNSFRLTYGFKEDQWYFMKSLLNNIQVLLNHVNVSDFVNQVSLSLYRFFIFINKGYSYWLIMRLRVNETFK